MPRAYIYVEKKGGAPYITIEDDEMNINEAGGTFNVTGGNLDGNVGIVTPQDFSATLSSDNNYFNNDYHYFAPNDRSLDGDVTVNYTGREFYASGTVSAEWGEVKDEITVNYAIDAIYIVTDNGVEGDWKFNEGTSMTNNNGVFTAEFTTTKPNTFILFAKKLGDGVNWGTRYVFGPTSNGDWGMPDQESAEGTIDVNSDHPIKFPYAGLYAITINTNDNDKSFTITRTLPQVAKPTFNPAAGSYDQFQTVTISCATEGATILYSTDNGDTWTEGNTVTVDKYMTIQAKANKDGMRESEVAEATYNLPTVVTNIAGADAVGESGGSTNFIFNGDAVVTYVGKSGNYDYFFIRDKGAENGGGVIFYNNATTLPDVEAGNVLKKGWTAQLRPYHNWKEYQYAKYVEASGETASAEPFDRTGVDLAPANALNTYVNEYIKLCNVTINGNTATYTSDETREATTVDYTLDNRFNVELVDGKTYDLTGVVTRDNSNIIVYPTAAELVKQKPGLEFDPASGEFYVGQKVTPELKNLPAEESVTYSSDNTDVATVDANGEITAVAAGTATIEAIFAGNDEFLPDTASYVITVLAKKDAGLSYGEEPVVKTATVGDETFDEPELINPHSVSPITYESSNTAVATVDASTGEVSIEGAGEAVISAKFAGNDEYLPDSVGYTINVAKKTMGLAFEPTSTQAYVGQDVTEPELKNLPEGLTVAYSSNNAAVATVDASTGVVTAAAPGEAIITAKFAGNDVYEADSASYTITVLAKKAAGLTYGEEPIVFNVKVGDDIEEPTLDNPNRLTVTYESSDTTVAKVDNLGNVTIVGAGTATITAKSEATTEYLAGEASYTINVTKKNATVTFSEHAYTVYVGNDFTAPTPTTDPVGLDVTYNIAGDVDAVLFDETDGTVVIGDVPGTVTITATFAGNATYNEASDSYTITIKAKEIATLSFDVEGITVYPNAENFDQPVLTTTPTGLAVEYTSSDDNIATVVEGELIIGQKTGTATITAKFKGNDTYGEAIASYTVTVEPRPIVVADDENVEFTLYVGETDSKTIDLAGENLKGNVTLTLNDETGFFTIDPTTIAKADAENATVTVTYAPTTEGIHEATVTISTPDALENVTVTLTGMATIRPVAAKPTFSPVPGSYTSAQTVTIGCETPGATIRYTVNGETTEATAPVTITLTDDANIEAVAIVNGMTDSEVAAGQYVIDLPTTLPDVTPFKGYYRIKNNGNNQYANIQGRKTLTFTNDTDKQAGTVIWLETNNKGQVQSLRSQAADLQGYADRAMRYVPEFVELAINKLHADGVGQILGEHGYDEIMEKFNESFDHHLYVEEAEGGYRLYGKTPSMQPVVDFYREHTNQVEAKLPMLEDFINQAIDKVLEKTNGKGASILQHFSVRETWQRMNNAYLTEPVDSASTMAFYREVLNNKNYVWSFAYETAMTYWERLKNNQTFIENKDKLGEFAQYLDKIEDVRPNFKYYIVQENNKPDYVSEGNKDIKDNAARTIWTLEPRDKFIVNIPEENLVGCELDPKYATTLYTDFAYTLPEGVKAYAVTRVTATGVIETEEIQDTIAAQTPVLLKADNAGDVELTLSLTNGAPVEDNLLVGADYLIDQYKLTTPQVESIFNLVKDIMGETFYTNYVAKYEHLMYKNSGMVNNKYFWALPQTDIEECVYINAYDEEDCVVRTLSANNGIVAFNNEWRSPRTNEAFLVNTEFASIGMYQKGDVNHDGAVDVQDVTLTISHILGEEIEGYFCTKCADADNDGAIDVNDVTTIIAIILYH